jgi:hypothetical protein
MSSGLRSRHVIATAATALAVFLAVLILLAVRMAGGDDPSLGAGAKPTATPVVTQEQIPEAEQQSYDTYGDDTYEDGYGSGTYDDQAEQPQSGQAPPMQSGTS